MCGGGVLFQNCRREGPPRNRDDSGQSRRCGILGSRPGVGDFFRAHADEYGGGSGSGGSGQCGGARAGDAATLRQVMNASTIRVERIEQGASVG